MATRPQADCVLPASGVPLVVVNGAVTHGFPRFELDEALGLLGAARGGMEAVETHDVAEFADVWTPAGARRLVLVGGDGTIHAAANLFDGAPFGAG
jgi:diacylglycerol kinase family enzyme